MLPLCSTYLFPVAEPFFFSYIGYLSEKNLAEKTLRRHRRFEKIKTYDLQVREFQENFDCLDGVCGSIFGCLDISSPCRRGLGHSPCQQLLPA